MFRVTFHFHGENIVQFIVPTEELRTVLVRHFMDGRNIRIVTQNLEAPEVPAVNYDFYSTPIYIQTTALTEEELSWHGHDRVVRIERLRDVVNREQVETPEAPPVPTRGRAYSAVWYGNVPDSPSDTTGVALNAATIPTISSRGL